MISLLVFIATLPLAVKLDNVRAATSRTWTSPLTFYYRQENNFYDKLLINIILANVPAKANRYVLYYQTDHCDRSTTGQRPAGCDEPARNDTIPTNRTISIWQKLNKKTMRVHIEIQKKNNKLCAMKQIMDGLTDNYANENNFRRNCLNKDWNSMCAITVDFENQCEEPLAKMYCSRNQRSTCEVVDEDLPEDTKHQWYQEYRDDTFIGAIPTVKGKKTEFKMTIYKFDSNTYIFSTMSSPHWGKNLTTDQFKVPLPEKESKNYDVEHNMTYTENEQVSFNCSNNAHAQIGVIEPTGYKITTYNKLIYYWRHIKQDNGTMLCCLNYFTDTDGIKTTIERIITDITVLIYEEPVNLHDKDQTRVKIHCSRKKRFTCEVLEKVLPEDTVHQWYQAYEDGSVIGTIPTVRGSKTEFKITFHKFDSNTYIFSTMSSTDWKNSLLTDQFNVPLPENGYKNYDVKHDMKKYTAKEQVSFNCSNRIVMKSDAHTQIGVIEPSGYRITTYNQTTFPWLLAKEHNGSMLCCLNYHTYTLAGIKTVVERNVTNVTVLIYEEYYQNEKGHPLNTPRTQLQQNATAATSNTHQPAGGAPAESTSPSGFTGKHSPEPESDSLWNNNYVIAMAAVAGLVLLASLTYVVIKKCCRKSSDPEQTLQLETYASSNMVLYAELDMPRGTGPAPATTEDATYAEIIGVLRPENEHVKK